MKTVLIADDEEGLRRLIRANVESEAYRVLEASDGNEAWDLVQRERPDVVLLDVSMPGLGGIAVAERIRDHPELRDVHVIMLSARSQDADVRAAYAAGAKRYLTKPFSPLELLTAVEEALNAP